MPHTAGSPTRCAEAAAAAAGDGASVASAAQTPRPHRISYPLPRAVVCAPSAMPQRAAGLGDLPDELLAACFDLVPLAQG